MPRIEKMTIKDLASFIVPTPITPTPVNDNTGINSQHKGKTFSITLSNWIDCKKITIYFNRFIHALFYLETITNQSIAKEFHRRITKLDCTSDRIQDVMEACKIGEEDAHFQELAKRIAHLAKELNLPMTRFTTSTPSTTLSPPSFVAKPMRSLLTLPLHEPLPSLPVKSQAQRTAASLFALMNLGSAAIKASDVSTDVSMILSFIVKTLKEMLREGLILPKEHPRIEKLIKVYSASIEIQIMHDELVKFYRKQGVLAEEVIDKKRALKEFIIAKLQRDKEVYLLTGYAKEPFGHAIGLKLVLVNINNELHVRGEVYNTGEGLSSYHGDTFVQALKLKYASILTLSEVPLDQLSSSCFLDALNDLMTQIYPLAATCIPQEAHTNYSIKDFYEAVLSLWPGKFIQGGQKQVARAAQRGGTCALKASFGPIKEGVSHQTAAYIKLKMRIETTLAHLTVNDFAPHHIPHLRWAVMKINRTLQKLVKREKSPEESALCTLFIQHAADVTQKVTKKIEEVRAQRKGALQPTFGDLSNHFVDRTDYQITTSHIPLFRNTHTKRNKKVDHSPGLLEDSCDFFSFAYDVQKAGLNHELRRHITQHFALLSEATEKWLTIDLEDDTLFCIEMLMSFLIESVHPPKGTSGYSTSTSSQLLVTSAVAAQILKRLQASGFVSQFYIDYLAEMLLKLLKDAGPQLRLYHPNTSKYLKMTHDILNQLTTGSVTAPTLNWKSKEQLLKVTYSSVADVAKDPVTKHVYDSLLAEPAYQFKEIRLQNRPYKPVDLVDRAAIGVESSYYNDDSIPKVRLNYLLLKLLNCLIVELGASGKINDGFWIGHWYRYSQEEKAPYRELVVRGFTADDPENPSHGLLCDAYFPWDASEGKSGMSERKMARQLLDKRMRVGDKSLCRETQNEQVLASCQPVMFGKTALPAQEYEALLAITTNDDTLIPQCIHYFQHYFFRLKDPRFQALFEAFVWTRHSDGASSILERILIDPNNQIADQFLSFLIDKIEKCHQNACISEQLTLMRILAQAYAYLELLGPPNRAQRAKACLKESASNLLEIKAHPCGKELMVRMWIMSLHSYVAKDEELVALCKSAYRTSVNYIDQQYNFDRRQILEDEGHEAGVFLRQEQDPPENRLPIGVLEGVYNLLEDKNPLVKKIYAPSNHFDQSCTIYEFKDRGILTRVTYSDQAFRMSQFRKDSHDCFRWFSYIPNAKFPLIQDLPEDHPCNEKEGTEKGILVKGTHKWLSEESLNHHPETLITSSEDQSVICYVSDRIIKGDQSGLTLATAYTSQHPFIKKLLSLDDAKNILIWKDEKHCIQQFDFSLMGLQLQLKNTPEGPQWESSYPKGYFLDTSTPVTDLEPYRHYIVLKNNKGKRIVLIPERQILPKKTTLFSGTAFHLESGKKPQLLMYQLNKKGKIVPSHRPLDILYLIHLALYNCDYERARRWLKYLSLHPTQWCRAEAQRVGRGWIEAEKEEEIDNHPHACAIRLKLRLIAAQSTEEIGRVFDVKAQQRDYFVYLNQLNSMKPDWLSIHEERIILKTLSSSQSESNLVIGTHRAKHLQADRSKQRRLQYWKLIESSPVAALVLNPLKPPVWLAQTSVQKEMFLCREKPRPLALQIRPGENFYLNFLYYYQIAAKGIEDNPQEFNSLMSLLQATQADSDPSLQFFRLILLTLATKGKNCSNLSLKATHEVLATYPPIDKLIQAAEEGQLHKLIETCSIHTSQPALPQWLFQSKIRRASRMNLVPNKVSSFVMSVAHSATLREVLRATGISSIAKRIKLDSGVQYLLSLFSKNAVTPNPHADYLVRDRVLINASVAFKRPQLTRNALVKEVMTFCLAPQDPLEKRREIEQELHVLKSIEAFYQEFYREVLVNSTPSSQRIFQGIQKEAEKYKKEIVKIEKGIPSYCCTLFSTEKKHLSDVEKEKGACEIQKKLNKALDEKTTELEEIKAAIVARIQSYPPRLQRQVNGGLIQPIGMKELIACFGRKDDQTVLDANPSLKHELASIKQQLAQYLVDKTEHQVLERSKCILEDLLEIATKEGWESTAARNASARFVTALTAKRAYQPDHPLFEALLVFETLADMRLHKSQVEALTTLTHGKIVDVEFEASTGFGKSQVLIPLWLFLTSRKERLTMMTVPMSLLQSQLSLLKDLLGEMFDVGVQLIDFERDKVCHAASVQRLNTQLESAQVEQRVSLIGIKPLHGLSGLALKQALFANTSNQANDIVLELIQLRNLLNTNMSNFFDESRECFDIRQRYDYAIGQPKPAPLSYCKEMGRFYAQVVLHPDVMRHWNVEFLSQRSVNDKIMITEDEFEKIGEKSLRAVLATRMVIYMQVEEDKLDAMKEHFLGMDNKEAEAYVQNMQGRQLELYKLCCRQMVTHLPRTLTKKCQESYDLSKNRLAIPSHRGEAKLTSEFAKIDDLMNFTIQANLKVDLDAETIQQFIDRLKDLLFHQDLATLNHESYQFFLEVQQAANLPSLNAFTKKDTIAFVQFLNSEQGFDLRLKFIASFILPKITIYPKKISGTPYTLIEGMHNVQAASGTPDPDMLPPRIKTIENPSAPIRNLCAIWKHSSVITTSKADPTALLKDLMTKGREHRVIIDAAGYFRGFSEDKIASIIFEHATNDAEVAINGLAYYDSTGRALILERGSLTPIPREESSLPLDEVMYYIRQNKSIGSNPLLTPTAKGWVTVGRDTTENVFLQASGRMRGLSTGQTIDFVTLDEDATVIKNKLKIHPLTQINLKHLLRHVKLNEIRQKGNDYTFGLRLYLQNLIEKQLWKKLEQPNELVARFKILEEVLVESTEIDLMDAPSLSQDILSPRQVVDLIKNTLLNPLKQNPAIVKIIDVAAIEAVFDKHVDLSKIPAQTKVHLGQSDEISVEVEHETLSEAAEMELEVDQLSERTRDSSLSFTPSQPLKWDGDYTRAFSGQKKDFLGLSLYSSPNFSILQSGRDLADKVRKPAYQQVLQINIKTKEVRLLAVDLHDMTAVLHNMQENRRKGVCPTNSQHHYYLIAKGQILASDALGTPLLLSEVLNGNQLIQAELLGKILSADSSLTAKENEWIKSLPSEQATQLIDFANDYLSVWPHLRHLISQMKPS